MLYGLVNTVIYVLFCSIWMTNLQLCQSASNSEWLLSFWRMKMKLLSVFTSDYCLFFLVNHGLDGLSAKLTIWTGGMSTNFMKEIDSKTYVKTLKRWNNEPIVFESMLLQHDNVRPLLVLPLQQWQRRSDTKLFHTSLQPRSGIVWLLVLCSCQETSQRNSFHARWRSPSCCGKVVKKSLNSSMAMD
jgi:hypothetical protein